MTTDEQTKYWLPAKRAMGRYPISIGGDSYERSKELAKLLGLPYLHVGFWNEIRLDDELKRKLEIIAGPHGPTIVKLLQIRKGELCHNQKENG